MPSVKIPRKSTDTDMTPFVDVAFLILAFFIMATKFKPPAPVEITTPKSVSTETLPENDAILVELDKDGKVFFSMLADNNPEAKYKVISNLNKIRNLGLSEAEMQNFKKTGAIGVPFAQLKDLLSRPVDQHGSLKMGGIPIQDSLQNELYYWVRDAHNAMSGREVHYMIKADNNSKYPQFKRVLEAFKRNEIFKFKLITSPEDAPMGSPLYKTRQKK
jgi:biopolymer transport protein ExbD